MSLEIETTFKKVGSGSVGITIDSAIRKLLDISIGDKAVVKAEENRLVIDIQSEDLTLDWLLAGVTEENSNYADVVLNDEPLNEEWPRV